MDSMLCRFNIETKGGMQAGHTKNIDRQVENKFNAFKEYAKKYNLHWGFVRDIDEELYINNTVYTEDMSGDNWIPLEHVLLWDLQIKVKG